MEPDVESSAYSESGPSGTGTCATISRQFSYRNGNFSCTGKMFPSGRFDTKAIDGGEFLPNRSIGLQRIGTLQRLIQKYYRSDAVAKYSEHGDFPGHPLATWKSAGEADPCGCRTEIPDLWAQESSKTRWQFILDIYYPG